MSNGTNPTPENTVHEGLSFSKGSTKFYIGFHKYAGNSAENFPDIVVPTLIKLVGTKWEVVDEFTPIWKNSESEFGESANYANFIVNYFNGALAKEEAGDLSYAEQVSLFIRTKIIFNGSKLVRL